MTVPGWRRGEEGRARILGREEGDRGIKPDILILEGWPENASPPTRPERWWKGTLGAQKRRVTVHIAEMGFSSDFTHRRKYENKQLHYQPLMEELRKAGWNVHGRVHVITGGGSSHSPQPERRSVEGNGRVGQEGQGESATGPPSVDIGQARSYDNCAIP